MIKNIKSKLTSISLFGFVILAGGGGLVLSLTTSSCGKHFSYPDFHIFFNTNQSWNVSGQAGSQTGTLEFDQTTKKYHSEHGGVDNPVVVTDTNTINKILTGWEGLSHDLNISIYFQGTNPYIRFDFKWQTSGEEYYPELTIDWDISGNEWTDFHLDNVVNCITTGITEEGKVGEVNDVPGKITVNWGITQ